MPALASDAACTDSGHSCTDQGLRGLILLAHGSRDPQWRQPIEAVLAAVQALQPGLISQCAYLEACEPDFLSAAHAMTAQGVTHLTVFPLFLGTGKHARADIPRLLQQLQQAQPHLQLKLLDAAGEDPRVINLLASMATQACTDAPMPA